MPFHIIEGDITKLDTDAIVNAANNTLLGGGGVDGAIHRAAGPQLLQECRTLNGCETGDAKITDAYNLPSKKVIHTVGPVWYGGTENEPELLKSCYQKSLELAKENGLNSIAFPLISSGIYGYPKDKALKIATDTIKEFLEDNEMYVYLVIFDQKSFQIDRDLKEDLSEYINENYVKGPKVRLKQNPNLSETIVGFEDAYLRELNCLAPVSTFSISEDLSDRIGNREDSFSELLLKKIDEAHMTDPECYKRANIDRRLFSKIKNNKDYCPSKETAIALALSLELSLEETNDLLERAGYTLSKNKLSDVIIQYFIDNKIFNIFQINEALFYYDQKLLGA